MFCGKCGFKLKENEKGFCPNCGAQLDSVSFPKKRKKTIIFLIVAGIAIIGIGISAVIGLKIKNANGFNKVAEAYEVAKAYENTINADNFRAIVEVRNRYSLVEFKLEVYGKGDTAEDTIVTFSEDTTDIRDFEKDDRVIILNGNYGYDNEGNCISTDVSMITRAMAKRDISMLYNAIFGASGSLANGFSYDELYRLFFDEILKYIKDEDDKIFEDISVGNGKYSVTAEFFPFCQALEENQDDDIAKAILKNYFTEQDKDEWWVNGESISWKKLKNRLDDLNIRIEIELEDQYIEYILLELENLELADTVTDQVLLYLEFDDVNEISEKESFGYNIITASSGQSSAPAKATEATTEAPTTTAAETMTEAPKVETLTGSAKGFGSDVTAILTVEDGKITACTLEGPDETPGVGGAALEELEKQVVAAGGYEIDGVTGATVTSNAVMKAVAAALGEEVVYVSGVVTEEQRSAIASILAREMERVCFEGDSDTYAIQIDNEIWSSVFTKEHVREAAWDYLYFSYYNKNLITPENAVNSEDPHFDRNSFYDREKVNELIENIYGVNPEFKSGEEIYFTEWDESYLEVSGNNITSKYYGMGNIDGVSFGEVENLTFSFDADGMLNVTGIFLMDSKSGELLVDRVAFHAVFKVNPNNRFPYQITFVRMDEVV